MKVTLQLFLTAVGFASVQAGGGNKLQEHEVCYVEYHAGKYQAYGAQCDNSQKLDCVYHIADDGTTNDPIAGMCENTDCYGSNSNQPPGEGTYRVTICHRTCSENNPWVRITIDEDAWDGAGCGHKQHKVYEDCNMENKDITAWRMGLQPQDYLIKRHGTRDHVRAVLEANNPGGDITTLEKDYWRYWEPACPFVRGDACCDWDSGECCGDGRHYAAKIASIHGDPHVKRWDRKTFQWHGECDMVLVQSEGISPDNKKLDLHVRTTITDHWSSVSSAVMQVGTFKFQVDQTAIWFQDGSIQDSDLPITNNGITAKAPVSDADMKNYTVILNDQSSIVFSIVGPFVNVEVHGHIYDFQDAVGLVGSFQNGKPIDRTGYRITDLDAHTAFWQVNPAHGDPTLFRTTREPQAPNTCTFPTVTARNRDRHLRADKELYEKAVASCEGKSNYELCIDDVIYTGEVGLAKFHE